MEKKYVVKLTEADRLTLNKLIKNGNDTAKRHKIAKVLLKADETEQRLSDEEVVEGLNVSLSTVQRIRKKYVSGGLEKVFEKKFTPRLSTRKFKGDEEAQLITLCCSEAPEGYARWSLRLLADKVVELQILDEVSYSTIHQTLKKMNLSLG
jgi:transposase